jgi:nucleotide-binding universal stress UspA family protein
MTQPAFNTDPEPAFTNVLCGVDDSRPSAEAARQAALLATPGGAVEFVGVCSTVGEGQQRVSSLNVGRVREALEDAGRAAIQAGASATWKILRQRDPAEALLEEAHGHDLAAVGSHAGSRASGIFFGSTASTLVHRADVPVLVARQPPAEDAFPNRILVASDGSRGSAEAARLAGRIGHAYGSDVTLVHVSDGETPTMRAELARQTVELLETVGREPAFCDASGDPRDEISRLAAELGAGLVVIGSRGLGGVKALGSVSERVAHRAPCSVLVARPPE